MTLFDMCYLICVAIKNLLFFVSGVVARSDSPLELGKEAQKDWTGFVDKPYSGSGTHQIVYNV